MLFSTFAQLSNKQKCLTMWVWLAAHPDKGKTDFFDSLQIDTTKDWDKEFDLLAPHNHCYACIEAAKQAKTDSQICHYCPITWISWDQNHCLLSDSPYFIWQNKHPSPEYFPNRVQAAQDIVNLIKTTWKE